MQACTVATCGCGKQYSKSGYNRHKLRLNNVTTPCPYPGCQKTASQANQIGIHLTKFHKLGCKLPGCKCNWTKKTSHGTWAHHAYSSLEDAIQQSRGGAAAAVLEVSATVHVAVAKESLDVAKAKYEAAAITSHANMPEGWDATLADTDYLVAAKAAKEVADSALAAKRTAILSRLSSAPTFSVQTGKVAKRCKLAPGVAKARRHAKKVRILAASALKKKEQAAKISSVIKGGPAPVVPPLSAATLAVAKNLAGARSMVLYAGGSLTPDESATNMFYSNIYKFKATACKPVPIQFTPAMIALIVAGATERASQP